MHSSVQDLTVRVAIVVSVVAASTSVVLTAYAIPANYALPVPICDGQAGRPAHSLTSWHALVAYAPDGSVLCTYGHAHGAQPDTAAMTNLFGALPQGQSISYPHATPNENLDSGEFPNKHRAYKWLTKIAACPPGATDHEITALRVLTHMDGSLGAAVRFHSYWVQAELTNCATGEKGQFYGGGWIDQSYLIAGDTRVNLPTDPPAGCILNGDLRQEDGVGQFAYPLPNSVWYGASSRSDNGSAPVCDNNPGDAEHWAFQMNQGIDQFGPVDPASPTTPYLYDPLYYRDSHASEHISSDGLSLLIPPEWSCAKGQTCAAVAGFSNSYGKVVSGCTVAGPQCVPFKRQNIHGNTDGSFTTFGIVAGDYDGAIPGPAPDRARAYYVADPVGAVVPGQPPSTATPTPVTGATATPTATPTPVTVTSTATPVTPTVTTVPTHMPTPRRTRIPRPTPTPGHR